MMPLAAGGSIAGCSAEDFFKGGAGSSASAALADPLDSSQISYGLSHYIVTGQSLSTGDQGFMGISNIQPFNNVMLGPNTDFNIATIGASSVTLTPLISGAQVRETMGNGFADSLTAAAQAILANVPGGPTSYNALMSCSGVPGYYYQQLCGPTDWNASNPYWAAGGGGTAGSPPFQEMMSQVTWGMKLASQLGVSYRVAAMLLIHGEFDNYNPRYAQDLQNWQFDMQNGVFAITGQTGIIPMIAAQTQAILGTEEFDTGGGYGLFEAALAQPTKIFIACPEYAMQHHVANEVGPDAGLTIHLTANGYRHLGLMMSKAGLVVTMEGKQWLPLAPLTYTLSGSQIVIEHNVPYPPLVLDTSWVSDPGNLGYSYADNADPTVVISSVAVTGPTEVTLALNKPSVGGTLGYADFAPPTDPSYIAYGPYDGSTTDYGPTYGPRGCLRDSDPAVAYYAPTVPYYTPSSSGVNQYPMQNYCVAYQVKLGNCVGAKTGTAQAAWRC